MIATLRSRERRSARSSTFSPATSRVTPFSTLADSYWAAIEVRGLNNKIRIRQPDSVAGTVDNYLASRVLRRVYVLHYSRPGDEFFRDQDRFVLADHGWEWLNTFQRIDQRKNVAYARYFLNNIADDQNKPVQSVEDEFWPYYDAVRETKPDARDKLPDLQSALKQGK